MTLTIVKTGTEQEENEILDFRLKKQYLGYLKKIDFITSGQNSFEVEGQNTLFSMELVLPCCNVYSVSVVRKSYSKSDESLILRCLLRADLLVEYCNNNFKMP